MKLFFALCLSIALLTGCASTPESQMKQLSGDARDVAEFGTMIALVENPANRVAIEAVVRGLVELEAQPDPITVDSLTAVLTRLPMKELQSEKAQLYILGGRVILRRATSAISLGSLGSVRPVVVALREGM